MTYSKRQLKRDVFGYSSEDELKQQYEAYTEKELRKDVTGYGSDKDLYKEVFGKRPKNR